MNSFWTGDFEPTEKAKAIIDAVMKERYVEVNGMKFLISRFAGENMIVPATPEALAVWRKEVVAEALERLNVAEMEELRRGGIEGGEKG